MLPGAGVGNTGGSKQSERGGLAVTRLGSAVVPMSRHSLGVGPYDANFLKPSSFNTNDDNYLAIH